jgi:hypothetical protein
MKDTFSADSEQTPPEVVGYTIFRVNADRDEAQIVVQPAQPAWMQWPPKPAGPTIWNI